MNTTITKNKNFKEEFVMTENKRKNQGMLGKATWHGGRQGDLSEGSWHGGRQGDLSEGSWHGGENGPLPDGELLWRKTRNTPQEDLTS